MKLPRRACRAYNDRARRRLARWFWAATFTPQFVLSPTDVQEEARTLAEWIQAAGPSGGVQPPEVVIACKAPDLTWLEGFATDEGGIGSTGQSSHYWHVETRVIR
jgi:hypothetical protein